MIEEEEIDDIEVLFHLETNEGRELYAFNVCNEEFEKNNNINKHI